MDAQEFSQKYSAELKAIGDAFAARLPQTVCRVVIHPTYNDTLINVRLEFEVAGHTGKLTCETCIGPEATDDPAIIEYMFAEIQRTLNETFAKAREAHPELIKP